MYLGLYVIFTCREVSQYFWVHVTFTGRLICLFFQLSFTLTSILEALQTKEVLCANELIYARSQFRQLFTIILCFVVCFLLGNSPASEFQTPRNYQEESIQSSEHGGSLKSRILCFPFQQNTVSSICPRLSRPSL